MIGGVNNWLTAVTPVTKKISKPCKYTFKKFNFYFLKIKENLIKKKFDKLILSLNKLCGDEFYGSKYEYVDLLLFNVNSS